MRVVLDTNVLISALISPGGEADLLYQAWRTGRFKLVSCEEQLEEFRRVSRYPRLRKFLEPAAAGTMVNEIRLLAELAARLPKVDLSPDPADNFLLALAQAAKADYLVTRDQRGLIALRRHEGARILSVRQMRELLQK